MVFGAELADSDAVKSFEDPGYLGIRDLSQQGRQVNIASAERKPVAQSKTIVESPVCDAELFKSACVVRNAKVSENGQGFSD